MISRTKESLLAFKIVEIIDFFSETLSLALLKVVAVSKHTNSFSSYGLKQWAIHVPKIGRTTDRRISLFGLSFVGRGVTEGWPSPI